MNFWESCWIQKHLHCAHVLNINNLTTSSHTMHFIQSSFCQSHKPGWTRCMFAYMWSEQVTFLKLLTHRQHLQRGRMLHVFSGISRSKRKCVQQLDSALWCPWVGHVTIKSGNDTFKGNLSCCWRFNSCQGIVKSISASPQTAEVSWITDDHSHLTRKRVLFSQSWNFRLQASISWRWNQKKIFKLVWQKHFF